MESAARLVENLYLHIHDQVPVPFTETVFAAITPCCAQARELVNRYRVEQSQLLFRSLRTMRKCHELSSLQPTAQELVKMQQLECGRLPGE